jgi:GNAT superfamily N-acetyltransferase
MTSADLEPAVAGILADEWGDRRAWFAFAVGHPQCHVVVVDLDGEVVGTGVATINGPVAWIGTIWVARSQRRHGLGTALTEATLDLAETAGCATQVLVATLEGRPLYERLGFEVAATYVTMEAPGRGGVAAGAAAVRVRDWREDDGLASLAALDRAATGEDRAHVLRAFVAPTTTRVVTAAADDGAIRGFLVRPPWGGGMTIAPDVDDALALLETRRDGYPTDRLVRCGVLEANVDGRERLAALGWTEAWRAPRLHRGAPLTWDPTAIWGQANHAMG